MVYPFKIDPPGNCIFIPQGVICACCGESVSDVAPSVEFAFVCSGNEPNVVYFHPKCAQHVALMMLRDVAEINCGKEIANERYRIIMQIVGHPKPGGI